ncbi:MAG: hypothetical protein AUJ52_05185 [Elusimicrobia bacterium CG1_02_63_36]|nr:MAG: hypothetical protein AUJ52_05185 [Elusimicrobia bacterium CG1_02_63_36]
MASNAGIDPKVEKQSREAVKKQEKKSSELIKVLNEDVTKGLENARKAVNALDEGKNKEALTLLKEAVGGFEVALAADPNLHLVPVSSVVQAQELYSNPGLLKRELAYAKDLLEDGKVQEARRILLPLRSDISVKTTFLPMRTYPEAIRTAVKQLVDEKPEEAKQTLSVAMSTLLVTEEVVAPIPLVTAKNFVEEASKMDKEKKDEVLQKLNMAREQLEVGKLLGYLPEDGKQYEEMEDRIKEIVTEVKGENKAKKMYKDLKAALSQWLPWGNSES